MTFFKKLQIKAKDLAYLKRTDIPLENDIQTKFLICLVALMTFLLVISCAGAIILNDVTNRWSSGLENKLTIEISSETPDGFLLTADAIKKEAKKVKNALENDADIKKIEILSDQDVRELISPWIGSEATLDGVPLPALITLEIEKKTPQNIKKLQGKVTRASDNARLETHEDWLDDFLQLINNFKVLALCVTLLIFFTTTIAITTAMHTRLALCKEDVELLHLIGASDSYIAKQFLPHALIITLKGSMIGAITALILTAFITHFSGTSMIPELKINITWYALLLLSPALLITIAVLTSYITLLRTLIKMP